MLIFQLILKDDQEHLHPRLKYYTSPIRGGHFPIARIFMHSFVDSTFKIGLKLSSKA